MIMLFNRILPADDTKQEDDDRNDKQDVDESAYRIRRHDSQEPEYQQNNCNSS